MKNKIQRRRSRRISCGQSIGTQAIRPHELGIVAGIGSLLDLGGTGFSFRSSKRIPGFEADVQNMRGDFDVAIERACTANSLNRIES